MSRLESLAIGVCILAVVVAWFFGWGRTENDSWDAHIEDNGEWRV